MIRGDNDRPYSPDGWGCGPSIAAALLLVLALPALLLVVVLVITVDIKQCCGLLAGDECDCGEITAELAEAMRSPLVLVHEAGTWRWER